MKFSIGHFSPLASSTLILISTIFSVGQTLSLEKTLEQVLEANLRLQVSQLDYGMAEERGP